MSGNVVCVGIDIDDVQHHGSALDRQTGEVLGLQCRPTLKGLIGPLENVLKHFGAVEHSPTRREVGEAVFGAPIAHEDHAQRACYAALHMRESARDVKRQHALDFATRIGINCGDVVFGRIGDDLRMDYTAQVHTVGLAQRMEALAAAGSICVSVRTAMLVSGWVNSARVSTVPVHADC